MKRSLTEVLRREHFGVMEGSHNEILLEAPIEATDEVALILKNTMEEDGRVFLKIVSVKAELINEYTKNNRGERRK